MLNLKEIAERISNPALCSSQDIDDLKKLCETYPYSQVFPILYLNALSRSNDVRFDDELQKNAYRISDRTVLYNLLNQTNYSTIARQVEKESIEEPRIETHTEEKKPVLESKDDLKVIPEEIELVNEEISEPKIEENKQTVEAKEFSDVAASTKEEAVIEASVNILEPSNSVESEEAKAIEIATEIIEETTIEKEPEADLQQQLKEEVLFDLNLISEIDEEVQEEIEATIDFEDRAKTSDEHESVVVEGFNSIPIDEVFKKLEEVQAEKTEIFDNELTAQTLAAAYSIEEEERLIVTLKPQKERLEDFPTDNDKIEAIGAKKSFSSWLHANKNYSETTNERENIDVLISKFIEESPKISPLEEKLFESRTEKTEFYSPTKKAKESLDEHNLPVSETLAKVFASQGNFPKAIYAYEQLMLIIPEKKIFFANQIRELEKKLNK